jgi:hypothetical protein
MTIFMNEQDIEFCVNAMKLIKDSNATFIKKDTSVIDDHCIDVYKNQDDKVVIKFTEQDCIKEGSTEHELIVIKENIEKLLCGLKDLGIIKEWFYNGVNGGYHWKF